MPVTIPTAADVRKAREQAAQTVVERAGAARTPLLAVLGAGDLAVTTVSKVVTDARARAATQAEGVQTRVAELPQRLKPSGVRQLVAELRTEAEQTYAEFAQRGEQAWGKIRKQPQVKQAVETIETYTDKLDARVDSLIDDAHDAAEKALRTVTRQTRSAGEKTAQATQRVAGGAAEKVADVAKDTSDIVAETGAEAATKIDEAGAEAAGTTRSVTRKAANRAAPKPAARKAPAAGSGSAES